MHVHAIILATWPWPMALSLHMYVLQFQDIDMHAMD